MCEDCLICSSYFQKFLFSYSQTKNKFVFKKERKKKKTCLITRVLIVGAADPVGLSHTQTRALARAHTRAHTRSPIQLVVILG